MQILKRQLLSTRYIQHSARVLFVVGQASRDDASRLLEAIFDLSRDEIVKRVQSGALSQAALATHDYVFDIFPQETGKQMPQGTVAVVAPEFLEHESGNCELPLSPRT